MFPSNYFNDQLHKIESNIKVLDNENVQLKGMRTTKSNKNKDIIDSTRYGTKNNQNKKYISE